jgi:putative membrane protein (TIGR04086 family)
MVRCYALLRLKDHGDQVKNIVWKSAVGGAVTGWICAGVGIGIALTGRLVLDWPGGRRTAVITIFGLLGCLLGGFRSGLLERRTPLSHGAVAGTLTTLPLALIGLAQSPGTARAVTGLFALLLGASAGTFGGMVSNGSSRGSADRK